MMATTARRTQRVLTPTAAEPAPGTSADRSTEGSHEAGYERPAVIEGTTWRIPTGCGSLFVTVNFDEGRVVETIARMGKAGGCAQAQMEALGRALTVAFRHGVSPQEMIRQLRGVGCHRPAYYQGEKVYSCADGMAQVLEKAVARHIGASPGALRVARPAPPGEGGPGRTDEEHRCTGRS